MKLGVLCSSLDCFLLENGLENHENHPFKTFVGHEEHLRIWFLFGSIPKGPICRPRKREKKSCKPGRRRNQSFACFSLFWMIFLDLWALWDAFFGCLKFF